MPTADQRALVENAAAFGLTQADSAEQLKIDEKTLRKHFQDELSSGKFKVDMTAGNVKKVWLLARRGSLEATMSYYLVERIKAQPNIEVLTRSEVTALEGCDGTPPSIVQDARSAQIMQLRTLRRSDPSHSWSDAIGSLL